MRGSKMMGLIMQCLAETCLVEVEEDLGVKGLAEVSLVVVR